MTKKRTSAAFVFGVNSLTPAEAGELAALIEADVNGYENPESIARLLLLVHAFTYEDDTTARENMQQSVEDKLSPFLPSHDKMVRGDMARVLDGLKRGGER